MRARLARVLSCLAAAALLQPAWLPAAPVAARQLEGELRGFLILRDATGAIIADGDLIQTTRGNLVTSRLVYHFKDGSVQDETAVISQRGQFRLLTDHLVQRGPVFKHPMDVSINASTGVVNVKSKDDHGNDKSTSEHMTLPPDLANGIVPILLKNIPNGQPAIFSMVVATPKPMLVKLAISSDGEDTFTTGTASHKATRYVVHVDIGGIKGVVAPLVGKQPADTRVWILGGDCPTLVRAEGPMFESGPIWRTELVSPTSFAGK